MPCFVALYLLITMSGPPAAQLSTQWSAVEALGAGTRILVAFPNGQHKNGLVEGVSDDDLTIADNNGRALVLHRRDIASVSVRESIGRSTRAAAFKGAIIGAAAAAVFAFFGYAAHDENHRFGQIETEIVLGGLAAGAAIGSRTQPKPVYRDRVIYTRQ